MLDCRLKYCATAFVFLFALPPLAVADQHGRAEPQAAVPNGTLSPHSGSPADWPEPVHDDAIFSQVLVDRLEYRDSMGAPNAWLWDAQGWIGSDTHRFWWKSEGEGPINDGGPESTSLELLYSRIISPFWNLQTGVRQDFNPDPDRRFAVVGLQGLAPFMLETDTSLYVSDEGDVSVGAEFEYEMMLSQQLVLQPRMELSASFSDVPEYGIERGLNSSEVGLRLRYELTREIGPYVGVSHERNHDRNDSTNALVFGVRAWY